MRPRVCVCVAFWQSAAPLASRFPLQAVLQRNRLKLEVVAKDSQVEQIIAAVIEQGRTGEIGDGKIFVRNLASAIRIRTGEKGEQAI